MENIRKPPRQVEVKEWEEDRGGQNLTTSLKGVKIGHGVSKEVS